MIEIDRHIEILLLDNDCVIVPGLGGFMTHHMEAVYDADDQLFLPPARTLGFNPQLTMNDSLLAQSYVEAYDISYPEAVKKIEDEVSQLKEHIENHGSYTLHGIGTLTANANGNYDFEPCEAGILTPSLYALSSFEMRQLSVAAEKQPLAEVLPQTSNVIPFPAQQEPAADTSDLDEEKQAKTISIRVSVLRNFIAAAIAVIAFLLIPTPVSNSQMQQGAINTEILDKIIPAQTPAVQPVAPQPETQPEPQAAVYEEVPQEASADASNFYCIVLASKVTKANAKAYTEKLHNQGYDKAEVLVRRNGAKVVYGHYKTENDAYNALNALSDNEPFSEGWVMHVK